MSELDCNHLYDDQETAVADGICPLCLQAKCAELERQVAELKAAIKESCDEQRADCLYDMNICCAGTDKQQETIAVQQQQIAVLREALKSAYDYPQVGGAYQPWMKLAEQALAQQFDTSALDVYRNKILDDVAKLFPQPHMEYFGENIQDELRRMKKG